ncbi:MAG: TIGR03086 family metal-binding protein [Acidimicrobiales bacterium]
MPEPIVVERVIDATGQEAFDLLTQPEQLRRWQAVSASVDVRVGGSYRLTVTPGHIAEGTYTEVAEGERLVYSFAWTDQPNMSSEVVIELEPMDDKTLVRLTHTGLVGDAAAGHREGWNHYLERLGVAATTGDAGADPWANAPEELDVLTAIEASWALCQDVMRGFEEQHRNAPTPCTDYSVHELVEHLMGSLRGLGGMAGAEVPESIDASTAEDYIAQAAEPAIAAWRARGVDGEVRFGEGMAPAWLPAGIINLEFLLHAWDFASAIGQPIDVPESLAAHTLDAARKIIQPDNRGEGKGFAQEVQPASDSTLDALLAFTGRSR